MTGKLGKFRVEYSMHGAAVIATADRLTCNCLAEGEIDAAIQSVKDDLDACAREMKRQARRYRDSAFLERAD